MPVGLHLTPNWSEGIRESFSFLSDVFVSQSGKEQRWALRQSPRRRVEIGVLLESKGISALIETKMEAGAQAITVPDFAYPQAYLVENASAGDTEAIILAQDGFAILPSDTIAIYANRSVEYVELADSEVVSGFSSGYDEGFSQQIRVTFADPLISDWTAGSILQPTLTGRIGNQSDLDHYAAGTAACTIQIDVTPGEDGAYAASSFPTLGGLEVLNARPNWNATVSRGFRREYDLVDYEQGLTAAFVKNEIPIRILSQDHLGKTKVEARQIVGLFHRMKGQVGEFLCPTWTDDMQPLYGLISGATRLRVVGTQIADRYQDLVHKAVAIVLKDGTVYPLRVTSIAVSSVTNDSQNPRGFSAGYDEGFDDLRSGEHSLLTLTDPVPALIERQNIAFICWMPRCRFATDVLTVQWVTDSVAQIKLNIRSLEAL